MFVGDGCAVSEQKQKVTKMHDIRESLSVRFVDVAAATAAVTMACT